MKCKVNEIFASLQGEGLYTGTPAVFLRLSGCNRNCDFCDTRHQQGHDMTYAEIVDAVKAYGIRHVVITGGEPTLQLNDTLVSMLKDAGLFLQIETNGTGAVPMGVDWVTCSPKTGPYGINRLDELKIVYQGQDVEALAQTFLKINPTARLALQPCSGRNIAETVDYIMRHPWWHLSLQMHKLIDIQ